MFADPMSIDFDGEKSFARVPSANPTKGVWKYENGDTLLEFNVSQNSTNARLRHEMRLTRTKVVEDPISGVNKAVSASAMIVIDEPKYGFSDAELGTVGLLGSILDTISDDSGLVVTKLLNGES